MAHEVGTSTRCLPGLNQYRDLWKLPISSVTSWPGSDDYPLLLREPGQPDRLRYSNRSEFMLGYCTKYGDNAADLQPIVHLYKTEVYTVARELGIPEPILTKAPSAGLWAGQSDEGELGLTYTEIDTSLKALGEHAWTADTPTEEKALPW